MSTRAITAMLVIPVLLLAFQAGASAYTHNDSLIQWQEYSPEAFSAATRENRPILMLVTAVWCHWCHVFEEKVLETEGVAGYVNNSFIPVFVDYDRRKDLVRKYPSYGLPSTVILAPDGEPLQAFPGYMNRKTFTARLNGVLRYLRAEYRPVKPPEAPAAAAGKLPTAAELDRFRAGFRRVFQVAYDSEYGGFGAEVKSPHGHALHYALDLYRETGDEQLRDMATHTLDRIAGLKREEADGQRPGADYLFSLYRDRRQEGWLEKVERLQRQHKIVGLLDPVEKGFFRLALLRDWGIPHYEKLLSTNAEMIKAYIHAYRITGKQEYKDIAEGTLGYVLGKLYNPDQGRFYGSQTADEVYYHLTAEERTRVEPPSIDTTSYAVSTAEMVETLLYAHKTLADDRYREAARKGLRFLKKALIGKRGAMSYYDPRDGRAHIDGQLADNAWMARAFLQAAEALNEKKYTRTALKLLNFSLNELYDTERGGFYERNSTSRGFYKKGEEVSKEKPFDANGLMALNLLAAYRRTGKRVYLNRARETLGVFVHGHIDADSPFLLQAAGELSSLLSRPQK